MLLTATASAISNRLYTIYRSRMHAVVIQYRILWNQALLINTQIIGTRYYVRHPPIVSPKYGMEFRRIELQVSFDSAVLCILQISAGLSILMGL